jgi:hypothetical protein
MMRFNRKPARDAIPLSRKLRTEKEVKQIPFGDDSQKGKGKSPSLSPSGMTARKAKAKAKVYPLRGGQPKGQRQKQDRLLSAGRVRQMAKLFSLYL